MSGGRLARQGPWQWRDHPLRRREDVVEAWVVLVVWLVVVGGGAAAGLLTARAATEVFARQRAERQPVRAVVVDAVPGGGGQGRGAGDLVQARVRWTGPDGSWRTGRTLVNAEVEAGSGVPLWQDAGGTLVPEPPGPGEAAAESGVLAAMAVLGVAGAAFGTGAVARWELDRRRLARWGREWESLSGR
ncbi:hypothetical protein ACFYOV_27300 [Streptomyces sp. NPDC005931]|uniref:Rv1733c family protein n=1 Tax=Streptomyces sp. NPDC005931 TaxID=3364737 RepID=UPI003686A2C3